MARDANNFLRDAHHLHLVDHLLQDSDALNLPQSLWKGRSNKDSKQVEIYTNLIGVIDWEIDLSST